MMRSSIASRWAGPRGMGQPERGAGKAPAADRARGGGPSPPQGERHALRPVPRPGHVPDRGRGGPGGRVRCPKHRAGRIAEVHQLSRVSGLSKGWAALRPSAREGGDPGSKANHRGRGLSRRHATPGRRLPERGVDLRDRAHHGAGARAVAVRRGGSAHQSTAGPAGAFANESSPAHPRGWPTERPNRCSRPDPGPRTAHSPRWSGDWSNGGRRMFVPAR